MYKDLNNLLMETLAIEARNRLHAVVLPLEDGSCEKITRDISLVRVQIPPTLAWKFSPIQTHQTVFRFNYKNNPVFYAEYDQEKAVDFIVREMIQDLVDVRYTQKYEISEDIMYKPTLDNDWSSISVVPRD